MPSSPRWLVGNVARDSRYFSELEELEGRIDRIALTAFDVFVLHREQVSELRVNELRRKVSWVLGKIRSRDSDPELARTNLE